VQNHKKIIIFLGDILALGTSFFLSLRIGYWSKFTPEVYATHIRPFLIIYTVWVFILFAFGMYEAENLRPKIKSIKNLFASLAIALLISVAFFYIFDIFGISPKTNLLINMGVFVVFFLAERRIVTSLFHKRYIEKILLIGDSEETKELAKEIKERKSVYYEIISNAGSLSQGVIEEIKNKKFNIVIFSKKDTEDTLFSSSVEDLLHSGAKFMDITEAYEKILGKIPANQIDDIWLITKVGTIKNKIYEAGKRLVEVILAFGTLVVLSPILLVLFALIKIEDGGPFIYSQIRTGKSGKSFRIYKIRSMIQNSEKNGAEWAKDRDPRITKIGKFLRKSHLDESMQLVNIIRGDISIVGPRPERPEIIKDLIPEIKNYNLRHIIKPGITGWAQINYKYGNSVEDSKQKFEYDLYYIKNRNIFMDIGIVIRTVQKIFN
jgi:exopolysaccharide biosynthesis polyprenyl glycosylphosphotransferase